MRRSRRRLEVERDALLAPVHRHEIGGLAVDEGAVAAGVVAAARRLDLQHAGAKVGQDHRAIGTGEDAREIENDDAGKRARHGHENAPPKRE